MGVFVWKMFDKTHIVYSVILSSKVKKNMLEPKELKTKIDIVLKGFASYKSMYMHKFKLKEKKKRKNKS